MWFQGIEMFKNKPALNREEMVKNFSAEGFTTNLKKRIPEEEEVIGGKEGKLYANRKDNRSLNFSMVAFDIKERIKLDKDKKILEVACGAGQLAHYLYYFTKNKNITATDGGKELIIAAQERYKKEPIKFFTKNIHSHPWKGKSDLVIIKDSFHHFRNPSQGMKELLSLVKKGGILYIYDLTRDAPSNQVARRLNTFEIEHEKKRFLASLNASLNLKEMKALIKKMGIKDFEYFYPLHFSNNNLKYHKEWIREDKTKEHTFHTLSRIYLIKKP